MKTNKINLRQWQKEALEQYQSNLLSEKQILWEATPGAGKTSAALMLVVHQLSQRISKRVITVVPTSHLKHQWAASAVRFGLHLDCDWKPGLAVGKRGYHGIVLTYHQVARHPKYLKRLAADAVVVLDEVHHAGSALSWGEALESAFSDANFILCLSGTPFRSDNAPIPFVHYDDNGESVPHYCYGYEQAIVDGVCRPAVFFSYGGDIGWTESERDFRLNFSDTVDRQLSSRRLAVALEPESGWIQPMLQDAHETLLKTRTDHPHAGAILIGANQTHARKLARELTAISGQAPTIVLSDDNKAQNKIKDFETSDKMWIVACNMVSEGVDIPRLRVAVFATTIKTKMYFRQFLGRIIRITPQPTGAQPAFCYLPADPELKTLAQEIEEQQRHFLKSKSSSDFDDLEPTRRESERSEKNWSALSGDNHGLENVFLSGSELDFWKSPGELGTATIPTAPPQQPDRQLTKTEIRHSLNKEIQQLVSRYHSKSGNSYSKIRSILNKKQQVKRQDDCTESQLNNRINILRSLLQR